MTTYTDPGAIGDVVGTSGRIEATWGNAVVSRIVHRFVSTAARAAAIPSPTEGMECYVTGQDAHYRHNGVRWMAYDNIMQTYSSVLAWSGGGGAAGNAVITGFYQRRGPMCMVKASFQWGSTTTAGIGQMLMVVPFTSAVASARDFGTGLYFDASSGTIYPLSATITGSQNYTDLRRMDDASLVTTAAPVTPATTDIIMVQIDMERSTYGADETAT